MRIILTESGMERYINRKKNKGYILGLADYTKVGPFSGDRYILVGGTSRITGKLKEKIVFRPCSEEASSLVNDKKIESGAPFNGVPLFEALKNNILYQVFGDKEIELPSDLPEPVPIK